MPNSESGEKGTFVRALLDHEFDKAKELLSAGLDINAPYNDRGWTALHAAVEHYALDAVVFLLLNHADPNRADNSGMTPLHLSIDAEADSASQEPPINGVPAVPGLEITKKLLDFGASPGAATHKGETPVDWAERSGHIQAAELLKFKGE